MITPLPGATPLVPGSCTLPLPGIMAAIVDELGHDMQNGHGGLLVVKRPWPSMIRTIWNDPERFVKSYFPNEINKGIYRSINSICFYLSPVALFVILFYSYTKRFTYLCHLVLGIGLSLAPIGAYLAVTGNFDLLPLLFSFAVIFWVSGFDIIYALQDIDFDQSQSLYSIPSQWGLKQSLSISRVLHVLSASLVITAYFLGGFHFLYLFGLLIFIGMLIYQQSIVKPYDLSKVNLAFMTANGIASIVFSVFVIGAMLIQMYL
jgi:hypothetical protein